MTFKKKMLYKKIALNIFLQNYMEKIMRVYENTTVQILNDYLRAKFETK